MAAADKFGVRGALRCSGGGVELALPLVPPLVLPPRASLPIGLPAESAATTFSACSGGRPKLTSGSLPKSRKWSKRDTPARWSFSKVADMEASTRNRKKERKREKTA